MRLVRDDVRPSQIITREALDNAAASIAATGGSTNGVLHLLAIARELGIPYTLEDFDAVAARTPVVASIKPGGRFVATDVHAAGGVALVARELLKRDDLLTPPRRRSTAARSPRSRADVEETPGQEVVVPIETPLKATGGLRDLRQPRAGRRDREARRARAARPPRAGPRLRLGGGVLRSRQGALDPARATSL